MVHYFPVVTEITFTKLIDAPVILRDGKIERKGKINPIQDRDSEGKLTGNLRIDIIYDNDVSYWERSVVHRSLTQQETNQLQKDGDGFRLEHADIFSSPSEFQAPIDLPLTP